MKHLKRNMVSEALAMLVCCICLRNGRTAAYSIRSGELVYAEVW